MKKKVIKAFRPVYPSPAALITSISKDGRPNIITLGEVFNISIHDPVILGIGIAKERYSHQLISQTREFVVNLATAAMVKQVDQCGKISGRDVDKFAKFGLTAVPAQKVKPPLIDECPINLECRVVSIQSVGDHDLFLGEVVVEHVDAKALDKDNHIISEKLDPLCYLQGEYWTAGKKIGHHGFTCE